MEKCEIEGCPLCVWGKSMNWEHIVDEDSPHLFLLNMDQMFRAVFDKMPKKEGA